MQQQQPQKSNKATKGKYKITTLGRGGSDLTATAIGASLQVDEVTVWKDVNGILTTDPNIIPHAQTVPYVTFEEASELAQFGAKVLHPVAMQPCLKHNIPVRVRNSYQPTHSGTWIRQPPQQLDHGTNEDNRNNHNHNDDNDKLATAITYKRGISVLDIHSTEMVGTYGFLAKVFAAFQKHQLSVDVLASSEVSVSLTLDETQHDQACIDCVMAELQSKGNNIEVVRKDDYSILTLIANIQRSSEVLATVFRVFHQEGIPVEMMSQGASKVNISFVIPTHDLERAIACLHDCFFGEQCVVDTTDIDVVLDGEQQQQEQQQQLEDTVSIHKFQTIDVPTKVLANSTNSIKVRDTNATLVSSLSTF